MKRTAIKKPFGKCQDCNDGKEKDLYTKRLCFYHYRLQKAIEADKKKKLKPVAPTLHELAFYAGGEELLNRVKNMKFKKTKINQRSTRTSSVNVYKEDKKWYDEQIELAQETPFCEECGVRLHNISRINISHILSKGSNPALRNHPNNYNILCITHHEQWEFGDKKAMKIYNKNQLTIQKLKQTA